MYLSPPILHAARATFPRVEAVWSHWALAYEFRGEHPVSGYPLLLRQRWREKVWVVSPKFHSHDMWK